MARGTLVKPGRLAAEEICIDTVGSAIYTFEGLYLFDPQTS